MTKTRLSLAILAATSVLLAGCLGDDKQSTTPTDAIVGFDPVPQSASDSAIIPFPFDGLFAGSATPTLAIPNPTSNPLITQLNQLDGFSTTASWFVDVFGFVDMATVPSHVLIINTATGKPLTYGTDFTVQLSTVKDNNVPLNQQRSRLLIEPLKPLSPSTTYLVALTSGIKTTEGGNVVASRIFQALRSSTAVTAQTDAYFNGFSTAQKVQLEALHSQLIYPVVQALQSLAGIKPENVVLAYSVTTQSTTKTLQQVAAATTAQSLSVQATGLTTQNINAALANTADVYKGKLTVPYYLGKAADNHSTVPLTSFWLADSAKPDTSAKLLGKISCAAYAAGVDLSGVTAKPSTSTTTCFPVPVKQSDETIPVLMTVPNTNSNQTKPTNGWPVVIFQHGITGDRSNMLAIGPSLASAGFVTVAIDLPLHGVALGNALRVDGVGERTFDLDLVNNTTSAAGPDGVVDSSGTHFINLSSPITSRDNLRQGASDLLTLRSSLANVDLDNDGQPDLDTSQIRFAGISLGGIVGGVFLGADSGSSQKVGASVLSVAGGSIAKLLDASKAFGPRISAGLASNGVTEGTDTYESFMRSAQTLIDSGDPINYAALAAQAHPLLLQEILNDTVVPNKSLAGAASSSQDFVAMSGFLGGTEPLAAALGLTTPITLDSPVLTADKVTDSNGLRRWVQYRQGSHGSLIDPAASPATTQEMQREVVYFLKTNGQCLPTGGGC